MPIQYPKLKENIRSLALQFDVTLRVCAFRYAHTCTVHSWSQSTCTYNYECVYKSYDWDQWSLL